MNTQLVNYQNNNQLVQFLTNHQSSLDDIIYILKNYGNQSVSLLKQLGTVTYFLPTVLSISFLQPEEGEPFSVIFTGSIVNNGASCPVSEIGVVYGNEENPTITGDKYVYTPTIQSGNFTIGPSVDFGFSRIYARTYATNRTGTSYGQNIMLTIELCLAKGTLITLFNGMKKPIEQITYTDFILVWNFDQKGFDGALPLWIMKANQTNKYNLLRFSDGSSLKTIEQHRIFNKEKQSFTYPLTDDTPIGTTTFNEKAEYVTLVSKEVIYEQIEYYNVITTKHINLFANGILTSARYNNLYPIVDMKFVKTYRPYISKDMYKNQIKYIYYDGLRLSEQLIPISDSVQYIQRLESTKRLH